MVNESFAGSKAPARCVKVEDSGQRIDNFLARVLKPLPKSRIYRMLRRGEVRVNGGRIKPDYRVQAGDEVRLPPVWTTAADTSRSEQASAGLQAESSTFVQLQKKILFEDRDLLVLDKPAGLAVHGGSGIKLGVIEALRRHRSDRFLELAHRLDRDTSGCLLIAKSRPALVELHSLQRARRINKTYQLLVCGRWPRRLTSVNLPLHRFVTATGERRVRVASHGKPAHTGFHLMRVGEIASWLQARLHTGRTHQIRVHAAASGHPLLGEDKYETSDSLLRTKQAAVRRLCLHASCINLEWQGARLRFEAPLPSLFARAWQHLCGDSAAS